MAENEKQSKKNNKKNNKDKVANDALNPNDPLGRVMFFGAKIKRDVRKFMIDSTLDSSIDQVTQIDITFLDPGLEKMASGLYKPKIPVAYEDYRLEVAAVNIDEQSTKEKVTVSCRPRIVRKLKNRRGKKVMRNTSPSDFVKAECKAVGAKFVVQPSAKRRQIARDVKAAGESQREERSTDTVPSSWTTFQRLADDIGYIVFESAGIIYFGKPSWLLKQGKSKAIPVNWMTGPEKYLVNKVPVCDKSTDYAATTVRVNVPIKRAREFRVGRIAKLKGVPGFNGFYLVESLNYSLLGGTDIEVGLTSPIDPEPMPRDKGKGGRGSGEGTGSGYAGGRSLRSLLKYTGFTGEGLEKAIAIVMAESGGNATVTGDGGQTDSKWGPSVGLFQIRSLRNPGASTGEDKLRDGKKLRDAMYNARVAFKFSNGGKDWSAWSVFTNGAYKKFYRKSTNYQIKNWTAPKPDRPAGRGGDKSSIDFVNFAMAQAGDAYVYGAEASLSDPNPSAFDCSELIEWAAHRAGVFMPDFSGAQIAYCQSKGRGISVEQAKRTRGAILYKPGHIAISLGNGSTIEAVGSGYGVRVMGPSRSFSWTAGGLVPGLRY